MQITICILYNNNYQEFTILSNHFCLLMSCHLFLGKINRRVVIFGEHDRINNNFLIDYYICSEYSVESRIEFIFEKINETRGMRGH